MTVVISGATARTAVETQGLRTPLEELSTELNRPIRVMARSGSQQAPDSVGWSTRQVGEAEITLEEARERGITVALWATLSPRANWQEITLPVTAWDVPAIAESLYEEITWEDTIIGEFTRQLVTIFPLFQAALPDDAIDELYRIPIRCCVDEEFLASHEERALSRDRDRFLQLASERDTTVIRQRRTTIQECLTNITQYEAYIRQQQETLTDNQAQLDAALASREQTDEETLATEWEKIGEHALVNRLQWSGRELHVFTEDIEMTDPRDGRTTIVGRFNLRLNFQNNNVIVRNLTNRRNGWDHPHVNNGDFCRGELGPTIHRLFTERQIGAAVNLIIDALSHVTPEDSWGRNVHWWYDDGDDIPEPEVVDE